MEPLWLWREIVLQLTIQVKRNAIIVFCLDKYLQLQQLMTVQEQLHVVYGAQQKDTITNH